MLDATGRGVDLTKDIVLKLYLRGMRAGQRVKVTLLFEKEPAGSEFEVAVERP